MRLIVVLLAAGLGLSLPGDEVQARGDEGGTLKGARGSPKAGSQPPARGTPSPGRGLMEEEGIFYFKGKPAGQDQPKLR
ncbi:MAG: hypothetical protein FJX20_10420 [Alphaproteobacteria bacterium]|nr:hypothetical protein [Alphaproteobacteria bacterium]